MRYSTPGFKKERSLVKKDQAYKRYLAHLPRRPLGLVAVSYTHLDVYKRQDLYNYGRTPIIWSRRNYIQGEDLKWTRDKKRRFDVYEGPIFNQKDSKKRIW